MNDQDVIDSTKCPLAGCQAIPGEPCWYHGYESTRYAQGPHWKRRQVHAANARGEPIGLSNCPICGVDSPHTHSELEKAMPATITIEMPALFVYAFENYNRQQARLHSFRRAAGKMLDDLRTSGAVQGTAPAKETDR